MYASGRSDRQTRHKLTAPCASAVCNNRRRDVIAVVAHQVSYLEILQLKIVAKQEREFGMARHGSRDRSVLAAYGCRPTVALSRPTDLPRYGANVGSSSFRPLQRRVHVPWLWSTNRTRLRSRVGLVKQRCCSRKSVNNKQLCSLNNLWAASARLEMRRKCSSLQPLS